MVRLPRLAPLHKWEYHYPHSSVDMFAECMLSFPANYSTIQQNLSPPLPRRSREQFGQICYFRLSEHCQVETFPFWLLIPFTLLGVGTLLTPSPTLSCQFRTKSSRARISILVIRKVTDKFQLDGCDKEYVIVMSYSQDSATTITDQTTL